jgi:IMP cyclohydrolase
MLVSGCTGPGLAIGRTSRSEWVVAYWITARSESSQNRVLVRRGNDLATAPADQSKPFDPRYTIYPAMRWARDYVVAANGDYTLDIDAAISSGRDWRRALRARSYEGDAPYYTPRIAGVLRFHDHAPRITWPRSYACRAAS